MPLDRPCQAMCIMVQRLFRSIFTIFTGRLEGIEPSLTVPQTVALPLSYSRHVLNYP